MAVRQVLKQGHMLLKEKCSEVDRVDSSVELVIEDLRDTLTLFQKERKGDFAISAPQIGYPFRIIYYQDPLRSFVLINPKIIWKSDDMVETAEICCTCNSGNKKGVKRHKLIRVEYCDEHGNEFIEKFINELAFTLQHKMEHLNGEI